MRLYFSIIAVLFCTSSLSAVVPKKSDADYHKINRSLEIFGSLFREVSQNYVDEIDPEKFVKIGIENMLTELDPYTKLYEEGESDDIDILTTGSYIGFGFNARRYVPAATRLLPVDVALLKPRESRGDAGIKLRATRCAVSDFGWELYFMKCWHYPFLALCLPICVASLLMICPWESMKLCAFGVVMLKTILLPPIF